jgi:glycosyltransferase involved in cell wall biosynthesis
VLKAGDRNLASSTFFQEDIMRIAQISPLIESVPPKLYGGTERVISYLTEELVRQGHEVTLFASGDSITAAHLIAGCRKSLRLEKGVADPLAHHILMLEKIWQQADRFEIIHNHLDYLSFPMIKRIGTPAVTTLHGRLDIPDLLPLYRKFKQTRLISISDSQREPIPWANWQDTVYHGLPVELYKPCLDPSGYLAFIGRVSPEKRVDRAIEIAHRSGRRLKIAAKIDRVDRDYYQTKIAPMLRGSDIEFIGEISESEKNTFLGNASALLFPVDWPEPFGMVLIEAMACGTPAIAYGRGSVPEVVEEGVSGFIVRSIPEAVEAVNKIESLDRATVRHAFESRFSAKRMAQDYIRIYQKQFESHAVAASGKVVNMN